MTELTHLTIADARAGLKAKKFSAAELAEAQRQAEALAQQAAVETRIATEREATEQAREKGALTGACFLELEAQPPELGVDFFNTFQESSRHFRQKWFEAADFCIFNVGGVGTLEEIGIELCNLKLGIRPRTPYVFFNAGFWGDLRRQLNTMIRERRAPAWMADYILFTDDPEEVVAFYRRKLQVL